MCGIRKIGYATVVALAMSAGPLLAKEIPVGKHVIQEGLEVAAVYLQPIEMEPAGMMRAASDSDVHLEADIHAAKDNRNGMPEGDWVPALQVGYELTKLDDGQTVKGDMMQMVASDGPHYGDNVKLFGPGKYKLKLTIAPPGPNQHFGRHVDKETGVGPWFKPFEVNQEFTYAGAGKKGTY